MAIYSTKVKRPRYFDRQQLAAQDLALGQIIILPELNN
jgi:hypothetical protein